MAQNDFGTINPNTKSGTDLASDLNDFRDAQNTNHNGSTQPSYVQTWMTWLDSTAANGVMKIYDGTDDVPVYVVDATNNVARVALDNDEDTYIVSSTDDTMTFVSSALTRMTLNASLLTMAVDIDMNGQGIRFDDATGIKDANNNEVMLFQTVTSAVNYFDFSPSATGSDLILAAAGDDTNIDLAVTPKGSGSLVLDGLSWPNADGSADQLLKTDGSGNLSFVDAGGGGGLQSVQVFTASGTWTKPAGISKVKVTVVGGGGGGGGGNTGDVGGSGGGGGGNAIEYIDVTGTSSATVTIGAAGSAGSAGGSGGTGGTSSFGSFCSATGGSGGVSNGTTVVSGGSGSGGDININGGYGGAPAGSGTERKYTNTNGGSSLFGFGASTDSSGGDAGVGYGAGGSGGIGGGAVGGAGTAGLIIVEEYA